MKLRFLSILALAAILLLSACNLSFGGQDKAAQVQTAAAETVNAQLTLNAQLTPSSTNTSAATATLAATNTPAITNTLPATNTASSGGGAGGCNAIQFVADVTVPDGEQIPPDSEFIKTWRLKNAGTCTWTTAYSVVFGSGNAMGGPATQALTADVAAGSNVDISLTLKTPHELGDYTGYWALRNASGQTFGSFYVQIKVANVGAGGGPGGTSLAASNVGQVRSDGTVAAGAHAGAASGVGVRAFVAFDISGIPSDATIEEVQVDFTDFSTDSNPFASMGCLQAFGGSFFPLDASDYSASGTGPDMEWCDSGDLSTVFVSDDVKVRLQDALGSSTTVEYQLRFTGAPTGSALVRFLSGIKLFVTYSEP